MSDQKPKRESTRAQKNPGSAVSNETSHKQYQLLLLQGSRFKTAIELSKPVNILWNSNF